MVPKSGRVNILTNLKSAHELFIQNQNQYFYIPIHPKHVLDHIGWFCLMEKSNLLWERGISRRKLSIQPVISLSMWIFSPIGHNDFQKMIAITIFSWHAIIQNVFHMNENIFLNQTFLHLLSFYLFYHSLISSSISYRAFVYICHFSLCFCPFCFF